ncbi:MAG: helix-turn-helix domain-containing protein, partial [Prevotella sp.]
AVPLIAYCLISEIFGYGIESFSQDLCMSRSTLYRKVVSLTGQKPSEFIRTIRLKRAAKLIKENRYAINEISDMCGFSSVSYFCRCFKAQYGVQPGSYQ